MPTVVTITKIRAPIERVFDLSRSVDLHVKSAGRTSERAIAGVTSGLLELGQEVTWRGKHFGIWQNLSSKITALDKPNHFRDSMTRGAFQKLDHDHFFEAQGTLTVMKDVFDFKSPLGVLGQVADSLFLTAYMRHFITERNAVIKATAEGNSWKAYLSADDSGYLNTPSS